MLDIIYRMCENESDGNNRYFRPNWYTKQNCLKSFLTALDVATHKLGRVIFLHDGPGDILLNMIPNKYEVVKIDKRRNYDSLFKAYEIADELTGDLYFVEDDYLHLPDSILKIATILPKFSLVSGYDHYSRYDPIKHTGEKDIDYKVQIVFDDETNHHWRTIESVCHTFAITRELYNRAQPVIRHPECISHDRNLFRALWYNNVPLWTPVPGITTQVDPYMSPGIDWEGFNKNV